MRTERGPLTPGVFVTVPVARVSAIAARAVC